ncbi:structural protein [Cellulophaga phage Calle_1]|uniref:Structural protein n=1 Tax=Cellulophaga phage Calle_1 TaxID=2745643 RepID=A0A8E5E901_9CAUD|nr:structural protein [Cellulophaga phage Calle_1]QQV89708.1 structural protein [Cellulophaga phage Calle_1]QQV89796.1 structural protein [Cellulophaga phage Calle_2]QQV89923.1 structural protein [Cellulophaga phage Calle_3]
MAPPKKKGALSKSAKFYRENPTARKKKASTDKKINARPEQKKKRSESGSKRYAAKKSGKNISGKDYDHAVGKFVPSSTNRGRKGEGGRKKK